VGKNDLLGELAYDSAPIPVSIGSDWARNASSEPFKGLIDEVALYPRRERSVARSVLMAQCTCVFSTRPR